MKTRLFKCFQDNFLSIISKNLVIVVILLFATLTGYSQVAINDTGNPPDPNAMLDVSSLNKGLLVPRILSLFRPPAQPGMLLYQMDLMVGYPPGFYYSDGNDWIRVGSSAFEYWFPAVGPDIRFTHKVALGEFTDADGHGINVQNYTAGKSAVRGADQDGGALYAEGMLGVLNPSLLGLPLSVEHAGVLGIKTALGINNSAAVYGWNNQGDGTQYAGVFISDGGAFTNYGVYARATTGINNYGVEARATGGGTNYAINAFTDNGTTNYAGVFKGRVTVEGHNGSNNVADSLFPEPLFSATTTHTRTFNSYAVYGQSTPQPGFGFGVYAEGGFKGVYGLASASTSVSHAIGVEGHASGTAGMRYGVYGSASNPGGLSAYGVYGQASGAAANWAGYFSGATYATELRIATETPASGYALSVNGKIACEEVLVDLDANWPDYVFRDDYKLLSIPELEKSIGENGHLPGLPSAQYVKENGFELADMQKRVLEKVEELTLYTIEQHKMIDQLQKEIELLKQGKQLKGQEKRRVAGRGVRTVGL